MLLRRAVIVVYFRGRYKVVKDPCLITGLPEIHAGRHGFICRQSGVADGNRVAGEFADVQYSAIEDQVLALDALQCSGDVRGLVEIQ